MNPIVGLVEFKTNGQKTVMTFDPDYRRLNLLEEGQVIAFFDHKEGMLPNFYVIQRSPGQNVKVIHFLKNSGEVSFGAKDASGRLNMLDSNGKQKIRLDATMAECMIGGHGYHGTLMLFGANAKNPDTGNKATIYLRGSDGWARVGGSGTNGILSVASATDKTVVQMDGKASVQVGGSGTNGTLTIKNDKDKAVITIDGKAGDIVLENADCAEEFDLEDSAQEPGSVLVFSDEPGRLRLSDSPYDTRVAGILSGGGDYRPAITLDRKPNRKGRRPVALVGKVWCKVEAESAPIGIGTLLTTSSVPGHAMAATDRTRAFGAVLGKALAPLAAGIGSVPVLVALQ
jgi:hypothetical protein